MRLPAELARQLGVGEGDALRLQSEAGAWQLSARAWRPQMSKHELMRKMRAHLAAMPRTPSVGEQLRDAAR